MSKRVRPGEGFYKLLNSVSSIDILDSPPKRGKTSHLDINSADLPQGVYEIERVIHQRKSSKVHLQI